MPVIQPFVSLHKMNVKILSFLVAFPICFAFVKINDFVYETFAYIGCLLLCLIASWQLASFFALRFINSRLPKVKPANKIVLVTGCDSGFGFLTAKTLNKYGFKVFAGCLFAEGDGAKQLKREATLADNLIIVSLDVTKDEHIDNVYAQIEAQVNDGYEFWGVVNNAGIACGIEVEWGSFDEHFRKTFDVNAFGVVKVTRKFLPLLRRSRGRIVNIDSVLGRFTVPQLVAYAMTKHAVVAFTDGLRREMIKFGVNAISIEPSFYATNIAKTIDIGIQKHWDQTNASIRNDYGEKYLQRLLKYNELLLPLLVRNKPEEVAEAVFDSLVSAVTETKYVCCAPFMRPIVALTSLMPLEFFDLICHIQLIVTKMNRPLPDFHND